MDENSILREWRKMIKFKENEEISTAAASQSKPISSDSQQIGKLVMMIWIRWTSTYPHTGRNSPTWTPTPSDEGVAQCGAVRTHPIFRNDRWENCNYYGFKARRRTEVLKLNSIVQCVERRFFSFFSEVFPATSGWVRMSASSINQRAQPTEIFLTVFRYSRDATNRLGGVTVVVNRFTRSLTTTHGETRREERILIGYSGK